MALILKNIDTVAKNVDTVGDALKTANKLGGTIGDAAKNVDEIKFDPKLLDVQRTVNKNADGVADAGANLKKVDGDDLGDAGKNLKKLDGDDAAAKQMKDLPANPTKTDESILKGETDVNKIAGDLGDDLADAQKTNKALSSKITDFMKKNPGKTLAGALVVGLGAAGLALAIESFNASNNQPLNITNSFATKGGDAGDITIEYTAGKDVTVVEGDNVVVNAPSGQDNLSVGSSGQAPASNYFVPSTIYGKTIQVKSIVSSSSIIINYPGLVAYANKGVLTLQTNMANRLLDQAEKGISAAQSLTGSVLGTVFGPVIKMLGPYLKYAQGCCCCICCIILLSIIYKVSKMAK
jgi:hypothetical protein